MPFTRVSPIFVSLVLLSLLFLLFGMAKWRQSSQSLIVPGSFHVDKRGDSIVLAHDDEGAILRMHSFPDRDEAEGLAYEEDRLVALRSLYEELNSPYPGVISNHVSCGEEFAPIKVSQGEREYYLLYASPRFTYGVCSWDLITYRALLSFIHCNQTMTLYQVEMFLPLSQNTTSYENQIKSLQCP